MGVNMWCQKLLYPLTLKVIEEDQPKANLFIDILFNGLQQISAPDPIPTEVFLNLIDRMYKKYEQTSNGSVTLADFSQSLLGLSMVFLKCSFDAAKYLSKSYKVFFTVVR